MDNEDDEAPTLLSQHLSNTDLQSCFPKAEEEEEGNVIAEELREEGKKAVDDGTSVENKGEEAGDVASRTTEAAVVVLEEREISDSVAEGQGMQDNEIVVEDKVALAIDEAENVTVNENERVEEGTEVDNVERGKAEEDEDDDADVECDDDNAAEIGHTEGTDDVIRDEEEALNEEQEQEEKGLGVHDGDSDDMTQDTDAAALMEEEEEADADDGDGMARDTEVAQGGEDEEGGEEGRGGDGMEEDNEVREEQSQSVSGGKRKRGATKKSKTTGRVVASKKKMEEDVCFICFDGGDLVLCNRR